MRAALETRAARLGEARAAAVRTRLREAVQVPGVRVAVEGERVVLSARGLADRLAREPDLRWVGGLLR